MRTLSHFFQDNAKLLLVWTIYTAICIAGGLTLALLVLIPGDLPGSLLPILAGVRNQHKLAFL